MRGIRLMSHLLWQRAVASTFGRRVGWNVVGSTCGRLSASALQIIIARHLVPSDYGVFALAVAWMAFFDMVKDLGLSHSIIVDQEKGDHIALQFAVQLALAVVFYMVTLVSSPYMAEWLMLPDLHAVLPLMSLSMFISAVSDPLITRYLKAQRYQLLAVRQIIIPLVMGVVGVALAYHDYGAYALVVGSVCGYLVGAVWLVAADRRMVYPCWDRKLFDRLFQLGKHVLVQRVAGYLPTQGDSFIVGSLLGPVDLGNYRLGNQLAFLVPTIAASPMAQVVFTDVSEHRDREHINRRYYQYVYMVGIAMLLYGVAGFFLAPDLVLLVLGSQWLEVVPVIQIFGVVMATGTMSMINADFAKVLGFAHVYTRFTIARSLVTLAAVLLAAKVSLEVVVATWVLSGMLANLVNDIIFYRMQDLIGLARGKVALIALAWAWAVGVILVIL